MPALLATELYLKEIFSSLQGEGILIGRRQLFVRLARCNLVCAYCDTDYVEEAVWHAEEQPGATTLQYYPNPVSTVFLSEFVRNWQARWPLHHSLALTGGEPLMQSDALAAWLPSVSTILPVFLETNGTLPDALPDLLPHLAWISMDIKLSGICGFPADWRAHEAFLDHARPKLCQVKIVVDAGTSEDELLQSARLVHRKAPEVPLVLQPRTVDARPALTGRHLLALQALVANEHPASLVIPQVHPLLAIS